MEDILEDLEVLFKFATINEKIDLIEARQIRKRIAQKLEFYHLALCDIERYYELGEGDLKKILEKVLT